VHILSTATRLQRLKTKSIPDIDPERAMLWSLGDP